MRWARANNVKPAEPGHPAMLWGDGHWEASGVRIGRALDRWADHGRLWQRRGQVVAATAEPYGLPDEWRDELQQLARDHHLVLKLRPPSESPYYPGRTWLVELWRR